MTVDLKRVVDERPMAPFQWLAVGICIVLNMIDGFDVLVMAFTASSVSAEWGLNGAQIGLLLSASSPFDSVLLAALRGRHAVVGADPDALATGTHARADRLGYWRDPGQQ